MFNVFVSTLLATRFFHSDHQLLSTVPCQQNTKTNSTLIGGAAPWAVP